MSPDEKNPVNEDCELSSFQIKIDLIDKIYNYAYWSRLSVTEAVNQIIEDGLKGKITKKIDH